MFRFYEILLFFAVVLYAVGMNMMLEIAKTIKSK